MWSLERAMQLAFAGEAFKEYCWSHCWLQPPWHGALLRPGLGQSVLASSRWLLLCTLKKQCLFHTGQRQSRRMHMRQQKNLTALRSTHF